MKKFAILLLCLVFSVCLLTACGNNKKDTINYNGRLKQYIPNEKTNTQKSTSSRIIDLSEGPKVKYDKNLGPADVNFDIKIKNPY